MELASVVCFSTHPNRFLVEEAYCHEPGCPCNDVQLTFVELRPRGRSRAKRCLTTARTTVTNNSHKSRGRRATPPVDTPRPVQTSPGRVGRNDPCPCGSGKKFKRCCAGRYRELDQLLPR